MAKDLLPAITRELTAIENTYLEDELPTDSGYLMLVAHRDNLLAELKPQHRLFVLIFVRKGSGTRAAREILGKVPDKYRTKAKRDQYFTEYARNWLQEKDVRAAIDAVCEVEQLRSGMSLAWKRSALKRVYELTTDESKPDAYYPNAGVKAVELLSKLDNNLQGGSASIYAQRVAAEKPSITLIVQSGIERDDAPKVIEHEATPAIQHKRPKATDFSGLIVPTVTETVSQ